MRKESYKILAEHFADKDGLSIEFKPGACPSTDGQLIILPTEVNEESINPLIGALLHETAHVKHTISPGEVFRDVSEFSRDCINTLEDIRVDHLTSLKYPNSYDFIRELMDRVISKKGAKFTKEPGPVQVLKSLIMRGAGYDPATLYTDPETLSLFKKCEHYVQEAKDAKDTWAVVDLARRLLIDLIGAQGEERERLQRLAKQAGQSLDKMLDLNKAYSDINPAIDKSQEALNKKYKDTRTQESILRRIKTQAENASNAEDKKELEKKAEQKQKVIDLMQKDKEETRAQHEKLYQERNKISKDFNEEKAKQESAEEDLQEAVKDLQPGDKGLSLSGFEALVKEDLAPDVKDTLETKTIDELIVEALLDKKEQLIVDEQGNKLNNGALAELETDPEKLFNIQEDRQHLTKVAFVLDVSGSMGNLSENNGRLNMAFKALDVLLRATKGAIDQGAPCDVSLYVFGNNCVRVFEGLTNYETNKTRELIKDKRGYAGGGTCLLDAVNMVSADLLIEAEHRAMVLITDADVDDNDCAEIINQTSGDCKQIFIAVQSDSLEGNVKELFGRNNIIDQESAMDIIGQALYQAI